jgi:long-chain acyl-CoA synthetase
VRPAATLEQVARRQAALETCYGLTADSQALVTTPLCHMFASNFAQTALRLGAPVVIMPRFDATEFLRLVAHHRITSAQVVPTMFVRLLRLAPEERARYDISSLRHVLHTGAPCPPDHPGTVGRPFLGSQIRIYSEAGEPCPPGTVGEIYARMPGTPDFTYLGLPEARAAVERDGLISAGDIGELDADGYLYLRDPAGDVQVAVDGKRAAVGVCR